MRKRFGQVAIGLATAVTAIATTTPASGSTLLVSTPFTGAGLLDVGFFTCTSSAIEGTYDTVGPVFEKVADITNQTCKGPFGITVTVSASGLPWGLTGWSSGTLGPVSMNISGPACYADISGPGSTPGTLNMSYNSSTNTMMWNGGNLVYENVSGCLGLAGNGSPAAVTAVYTITP